MDEFVIEEGDVAIGEVCSREVVVMSRDESVAAAARLMLQHHVGTVVVVEDAAGGRRDPVGIITDRDVAVGVVALGLDPGETPVGSVIRGRLVSVRDDEGIGRAVDLMRSKGLRRLPVVDASGALVGVLSADDLLELFTEEMSALAGMVARGMRREQDEHPAGPKL